MHKSLTSLLVLTLCASLAFAEEPARMQRTDLSPKDLARIAAVTTPTTDFDRPENFEAMQGGAGTVTKLVNRDIFSFSLANLTFEQESDFKLGNAFFTKLWVSAPSSTEASDGLGPLFNSRACQNCHLKDGRGHPPLDAGGSSESMFLRLSVTAQTAAEERALADYTLAVIGDPTYGTQLQDFAVPGLEPEGRMVVDYADVPVTLGDGTVVTLRAPTYAVADLAYGPMSPAVMLSPRMASPMIGLGLVEDVPAADILAGADPDDADGDGISGRPNWALDPRTGEVALGRFGWKAGVPTIEAQSAAAFAGDIGIATPLLDQPAGDCTAVQTACLDAPTGVQARLGASEAPDPVLPLVTFYSQNVGVPQRRDVGEAAVLRGKQAFYEAGCIACHTPKFVTSRDAENPAHRFQLIWPYSDFLLHDLGEGLADHRPEGDASGSEWRTPPLWGLGLTETVAGHAFFLHDGRARSLPEAILWHGGEAQAARDRFAAMSAAERADMIAFLESL